MRILSRQQGGDDVENPLTGTLDLPPLCYTFDTRRGAGNDDNVRETKGNWFINSANATVGTTCMQSARSIESTTPTLQRTTTGQTEGGS